MRKAYHWLDFGTPLPRKPDATWKARCLDCWREAKGLYSGPVPTQAAVPAIEPAKTKRSL